MRVDFTTFAAEPPEPGKPGRSGQTDTAGATSTADAVESGAASNTSKGTSTAAATSTASSSDSSAVDQTRFSFDQARLQSLEAQVLAQPEVRATKVQALQTSIESGDYSIPPSHVAEAIASEYGA
jgi:flagellar biosynthesis anti-sigma factor FlgM